MKKITISEKIFNMMIKNESFEETLLNEIKSKEFVDLGMPHVWAGLLRFSNDKIFNLLLSEGVYPNENSQIIEQIFFHYNCLEKRRDELAEKMKICLNILEKTDAGKTSIVFDIEKYFSYYGRVIVNQDVYEFIEPIYQKYSKNPIKIYYLEAVNLLKFYNTLEKSMFELSSFKENGPAMLNKLVNTNYWSRIKQIKFYKEGEQKQWKEFCDKYKEVIKIENLLPEKNIINKTNKI